LASAGFLVTDRKFSEREGGKDCLAAHAAWGQLWPRRKEQGRLERRGFTSALLASAAGRLQACLARTPCPSVPAWAGCAAQAGVPGMRRADTYDRLLVPW